METGVAPEEYRNDVLFADKLLCWGEADATFFRRWCGVDAVPVGSAHLDSLRQIQRTDAWERRRQRVRRRLGIEATSPCAVYVLQNMAGNIFSNPYRYRLPDVEWELERAIIQVFHDFPEITLIIKINPSRQYPVPPVKKLIEDLRMNNVKLIRDGSTADWLAAGDLFITDYPTTSFLEMLTTDKPILVCGHEIPLRFSPGQWQPTLAKMWSDRVVYRNHITSFTEELRTILRKRLFGPVTSDSGLLCNFGTHFDDGQSVRRVFEALQTLQCEQ